MKKRDSSHLTPPINDVQKRYMWTADDYWKNNPYHVLSTQEPDENIDENIDDTDNPTTSQGNNNQSNIHEKVPPIFIHKIKNHQEIIKDIKNTIKQDFATEFKHKYLKIQLQTSEDYRDLTNFYNEHKIEYHSFQDYKNKPLSVVLKNVPISLTNDEIKNELLTNNLPVISVTRLISRDKQPLSTCAVLLTPSEAAKDIFKVEFVCKAKIIVEIRRKPSSIPQCHRCQEFGHTKNYCKANYRCVKCSQNHCPGECKMRPSDRPTCANCGGDHPASYRGCPHHKQLMQKRANLRNTMPQLQPVQIQATTNPMNRKSYSQATSQNYSPNTSSNNFLDNLFSILKQLITPLLPQIKAFLANLLPSFING